MKVCLVVPPGDMIRDVSYGCWHERKVNYLWPPLNLTYYTSVLAQDHDVEILDCQAARLSLDDSIKKIVCVYVQIKLNKLRNYSFKNIKFCSILIFKIE